MADTTEPQSRPIVTRLEARANRAAAIASSVKIYMGRSCCHNHDGRRYANSGVCVMCALAGDWRAANRERCAELARLRYIANPEGPREATRKSRLKNIEAHRAADRARYAADRIKQIADSAAWNKANRERVRAREAARRAANPEQDRVKCRNRNAIKRTAEGHHTVEQITDLFAKQRGKCASCLTSIKKGYHADHIKALARGGSNWISNIQLLCPTCNHRKHAKDPIAFAQENGRLL